MNDYLGMLESVAKLVEHDNDLPPGITRADISDCIHTLKEAVRFIKPDADNILDAVVIAVSDSCGSENPEQAAIAILHNRGWYANMTCDEERELDSLVRERFTR